MLNEIKKWLSEPGNTKAELAAFLGYTTTDAITKWVSRGRVPPYMARQVKTFLKRRSK